jgi:hypothetical protein
LSEIEDIADNNDCVAAEGKLNTLGRSLTTAFGGGLLVGLMHLKVPLTFFIQRSKISPVPI